MRDSFRSGAILPVLLGIAAAQPRATAATLEDTVRALIAQDRCAPELTAVCVISEKGVEAAALNADAPLVPASNMKILTTAAACHFLGLNHEFETRIIARGPIGNGVLRGDMVVWGTGDPNISGRLFDGDPLAVFRGWARTIRSRGLCEISGDLVADDTYFDDARFLPTWQRREEGRWYCAQISPLTFNDNCIDVCIRPTKPGQPAAVGVFPSSGYAQVSGAPTTVSKGETSIALLRKTGTNAIRVRGTISQRDREWKDHVAINDPALFFVHTLAQVLKDEGVALLGKVRRVDRAQRYGAGRAEGFASQEGDQLLVRHTSSLSCDLPIINSRSQNLHAELLLKALGVRVAGEGSLAGGERAIREFLKAREIPATGLSVADGSGLSHENRVTARTLARTLDAARSVEGHTAYRDSFAVAGRSGTLERRFRSHPHLAGKVSAKTGYVSGVSALSGYVERGSKTWVFAILLNSFPRGQGAAKRLQESIVGEVYKAME